jgi:hypothetical protein
MWKEAVPDSLNLYLSIDVDQMRERNETRFPVGCLV